MEERKITTKLHLWRPRQWTFSVLHTAFNPCRLGISSGLQKDPDNFSFSFDNSTGFY
jgi:hypothetical protein